MYNAHMEPMLERYILDNYSECYEDYPLEILDIRVNDRSPTVYEVKVSNPCLYEGYEYISIETTNVLVWMYNKMSKIIC